MNDTLRMGALASLVGLLALPGCNKPSRPDRVFFNGAKYELDQVMRGGDVQNYFYTPNGEPMNAGAKEFLQLVMFDHEIPVDARRKSLPGLASQYGLQKSTAVPQSYSGTMDKGGGLHIVGLGREIMIDDRLHFAVYVRMVEAKEAAATLARIRDDIERGLRLLPEQL